MRVIAGTRKGITLRCGHGPVLRPTAQIVKGSVFDTIGGEIGGAIFLDLFAGSGSMGIEALSRGASKACFVEQDHRILKALRTNLQRCAFGPEHAVVRVGDAVRFLDRMIARSERFDVIFADPPYGSGLAQAVVERVEGAPQRICTLLVVEHGHAVYHNDGGVLERIRTRKFGQTFVTYFRYGR